MNTETTRNSKNNESGDGDEDEKETGGGRHRKRNSETVRRWEDPPAETGYDAHGEESCTF